MKPHEAEDGKMWILIGISVAVLVVIAAVVLLGRGGSSFPPGTRAFEAQLTIPLIRAEIGRLRELQMATRDALEQERIQRKILFLSDQSDELGRIVQSRDLSPGRGYVGFVPPPE